MNILKSIAISLLFPIALAHASDPGNFLKNEENNDNEISSSVKNNSNCITAIIFSGMRRLFLRGFDKNF